MSSALPKIVLNSTNELVLDFTGTNPDQYVDQNNNLKIHLTNKRASGHNGGSGGDGSFLYHLTKAEIESTKNSPIPYIELTGITNADLSKYDMTAQNIIDGETLNVQLVGKSRFNFNVSYDASGGKFLYRGQTVSEKKFVDRQVTSNDVSFANVSVVKANATQDRAFVVSYIQKNENVNEIYLIADTQVDYTDSSGVFRSNKNVIITTKFTATTPGVDVVDVCNNLINLDDYVFKYPFPSGTEIQLTDEYNNDGTNKTLTNFSNLIFAINDVPSEFTLYGSNNKFFYDNGAQSTFHVNAVDTPTAIKSITIRENVDLYSLDNPLEQTDGCVLLEVEMNGATSDGETQKLTAAFVDPSDNSIYMKELDSAIGNGETKTYLLTCNDGRKRVNPVCDISHVFDVSSSSVSNEAIYNILTLNRSTGYIKNNTDKLKIYLFTQTNSGNINRFSIQPTVLTEPVSSPEELLSNFENYIKDNMNKLDDAINLSNCKVLVKPNPTLTQKYFQAALGGNNVSYEWNSNNYFENKVKFTDASNRETNILLKSSELPKSDESYLKNIDLTAMEIQDNGRMPIVLRNFNKDNAGGWNTPVMNRVQRTNMVGLSTNDSSSAEIDVILTLTFNERIIPNIFQGSVTNTNRTVSVLLRREIAYFRSLSGFISNTSVSCESQDSNSLNPMFNKININPDVGFNTLANNTKGNGFLLYSDHGSIIDNVDSTGDVFNVTRRDINNTTDTDSETKQLEVDKKRAFTFKTIVNADQTQNIGTELQSANINEKFIFRGFNDIIDLSNSTYNLTNNSDIPTLQTFTMPVSADFKRFINTTMVNNGVDASFELVADNISNIPLVYDSLNSTLRNSNINTEDPYLKDLDKFPENTFKLSVTYNSNKTSNNTSSEKYDTNDIVNQKSGLLKAGNVEDFNTISTLLGISDNPYSIQNNDNTDPFKQTFTMQISDTFRNLINTKNLTVFKLVSSDYQEIDLTIDGSQSVLSNNSIRSIHLSDSIFSGTTLTRFPENTYNLFTSDANNIISYTSENPLNHTASVANFKDFDTIANLSNNKFTSLNNSNNPLTQDFSMPMSDGLQTLVNSGLVSEFKLVKVSGSNTNTDIHLKVNGNNLINDLSYNNLDYDRHVDLSDNKLSTDYKLTVNYDNSESLVTDSTIVRSDTDVDVFKTFDSIVDRDDNKYSTTQSVNNPLTQNFTMPMSPDLQTLVRNGFVSGFKLIHNEDASKNVHLDVSGSSLVNNTTTNTLDLNYTDDNRVFDDNYKLQAIYSGIISTTGTNQRNISTTDKIKPASRATIKVMNDLFDTSANRYTTTNNGGAKAFTQTFSISMSDDLQTLVRNGFVSGFKLTSTDASYDDINLNVSDTNFVNTNIMRTKHSNNLSDTVSLGDASRNFVDGKYKFKLTYTPRHTFNGVNVSSENLTTEELLKPSSNIEAFNNFNNVVSPEKAFTFSARSSVDNSNNDVVTIKCDASNSNVATLGITELKCRFITSRFGIDANATQNTTNATTGKKLFNFSNGSSTSELSLTLDASSSENTLQLSRGDQLTKINEHFNVTCNSNGEVLQFLNLVREDLTTIENNETELLNIPYRVEDYSNKRSADNPNGALSTNVTIQQKIQADFNALNIIENAGEIWSHSNPYSEVSLKPSFPQNNNFNCVDQAAEGVNNPYELLYKTLAPRIRDLLVPSHFTSVGLMCMMNITFSDVSEDDTTGAPTGTVRLVLTISNGYDLPKEIFDLTIPITHKVQTCRRIKISNLLNLTDGAISDMNNILYSNTITRLPLYYDESVKLLALNANGNTWDSNSFASDLSQRIFNLSSFSNKLPATRNDLLNGNTDSIGLFVDYRLVNKVGQSLDTTSGPMEIYKNTNVNSLPSLKTSGTLLNTYKQNINHDSSFNPSLNALKTNIEITFTFKDNSNNLLSVVAPNETIINIVRKPFIEDIFKTKLITKDTGTTYLSDSAWLVVNKPVYDPSNNVINFNGTNPNVGFTLKNTNHPLVVTPNNGLTAADVVMGTSLIFMPEIDNNELTLYAGTKQGQYGTTFRHQRSGNDSNYTIKYDSSNNSPWKVNNKDYRVAGNSFAYVLGLTTGDIIDPINNSISRDETYIQGTPGLVTGQDFGPNNTIKKLENTNFKNRVQTHSDSSYGLLSFYSGGDHGFELLMIIDDDSNPGDIANSYNGLGNLKFTSANFNRATGRGAYLHRASDKIGIDVSNNNKFWNSENSITSNNQIVGMAKDVNGNLLVGQYRVSDGALMNVLSLKTPDNSYNTYPSTHLRNIDISDNIPSENSVGRLGNSWDKKDNKPVRLGMFVDDEGDEYILAHLILVKRTGKNGSTDNFDGAEMAILVMDTADDVVEPSVNNYGAILVTSGASTIKRDNIEITN